MNILARRQGCVLSLSVTVILTAAGCAGTPGFQLNQQSAGQYLRNDGLYHLTGVSGLDGSDLPESSTSNGLWTTAGVVRLAQQQGDNFVPEESTIETLRSQAASAPADMSEDVSLSMGIARLCALIDDESADCEGIRTRARDWLSSANETELSGFNRAKLLEVAGDLGIANLDATRAFSGAFTKADQDTCAQSDSARYEVRTVETPTLRTASDPRSLTEKVLQALSERDIAAAYCRSGVVALTEGATPINEEDWLQEKFDDAIARSFSRTDSGLFEVNRGAEMDPLAVSMMLAQVAFDLSVELP